MQARVPSAPVVRRRHRRTIWFPTSNLLPTLAALSFGPRLRGSASFHAQATVSATEVSLRPVLVQGRIQGGD